MALREESGEKVMQREAGTVERKVNRDKDYYRQSVNIRGHQMRLRAYDGSAFLVG